MYAQTLTSERRELLRSSRVLDAAHLVRGVGSVGTQCFAVLLVGATSEDLLLPAGEGGAALGRSAARGQRETVEPGERVVSGQRLMQATPDVLLGWYSARGPRAGRSFYVRQLSTSAPWSTSSACRRCSGAPTGAPAPGCWRAPTPARAARPRSPGYLGEGRQFARSMAAFALAYRDRNDERLPRIH